MPGGHSQGYLSLSRAATQSGPQAWPRTSRRNAGEPRAFQQSAVAVGQLLRVSSSAWVASMWRGSAARSWPGCAHVASKRANMAHAQLPRLESCDASHTKPRHLTPAVPKYVRQVFKDVPCRPHTQDAGNGFLEICKSGLIDANRGNQGSLPKGNHDEAPKGQGSKQVPPPNVSNINQNHFTLDGTYPSRSSNSPGRPVKYISQTLIALKAFQHLLPEPASSQVTPSPVWSGSSTKRKLISPATL